MKPVSFAFISGYETWALFKIIWYFFTVFDKAFIAHPNPHKKPLWKTIRTWRILSLLGDALKMLITLRSCILASWTCFASSCFSASTRLAASASWQSSSVSCRSFFALSSSFRTSSRSSSHRDDAFTLATSAWLGETQWLAQYQICFTLS